MKFVELSVKCYAHSKLCTEKKMTKFLFLVFFAAGAWNFGASARTLKATEHSNDVTACVSLYSHKDYEESLLKYCLSIKSAGCINITEQSGWRRDASSFQVEGAATGITFYSEPGCNGNSNQYNGKEACQRDLDTERCKMQFNDRIASFRFTPYRPPFEAFDEHPVYQMTIKDENDDFSRCVHFYKPNGKNVLRYCDSYEACALLPDNWQNEVSAVWFDGLVDGIEVYSDHECTLNGGFIPSTFPASINSFENTPKSFRTFRIKTAGSIVPYIGRSIYNIDFKVDDSDFPSIQSQLQSAIEREAPKLSESLDLEFLSEVPVLSEILAVAPIVKRIFGGNDDVESVWKQNLVKNIPEISEKVVAKDAINHVSSKVAMVTQNIEFAKRTGFSGASLVYLDHTMDDDLDYIVNYIGNDDGVFRKYPLQSINPILGVSTLVSLYYSLASGEESPNTQLLNKTRQLINDFGVLGSAARIDRLKNYGGNSYKRLFERVKATPYTEVDFLNDSKRILCAPSPDLTVGQCLEDDLNAERRICSESFDRTECFEGYAKYVKYRFEQAYKLSFANILKLLDKVDRK